MCASKRKNELETMSHLKINTCGTPCNPSLKPYPNFNVQSDVELLKKAMDGMGTDEAMIVDILGTRTSQQRVEIAEAYKASYGEDLQKRLKRELSGDFKKLVSLMFYTIPQLKARIIYDAIHGLGTDERALVEVICTSTNSEIEQLKKDYAKTSEDSLEEDIKGDTSGYFKRILVALLAAQRHEPTEQQLKDLANRGLDAVIDKRAAEMDAQKLYDAGEKKLGTDEETFINILCTRGPWQLAAIAKAYEKISDKRLIEAIKHNYCNHFDNIAKNPSRYYQGKINPNQTFTVLSFKPVAANINTPMAFAALLEESMRGAGTNDNQLMRIIVWRSEVDMKEIKNCYLARYNRELVDDVKDDTSGDYEALLCRLLGSQKCRGPVARSEPILLNQQMTVEELLEINNFIQPLDDGVVDDNLDDDLALFFNNSILIPPPNGLKDDSIHFPKLLYICILYDNTSVFVHETAMISLRAHCTHDLTHVLDQMTHIDSLCIPTHIRADVLVTHLFLRCPLNAFVPYLSLTRLNPHCGLSQLLQSRSVHRLALTAPTGY
ncbi:hypothetical protein ACTXT7_006033 [Hymenolepis weldensis]